MTASADFSQGVFALIGVVVGALVSGIVSYLVQNRTHHREEMVRWRDRATETLGRVRVMLADLNPVLVAAEPPPPDIETAQQRFEEKVDPWRELRVLVAQLAYGHPDERTRSLVDDLVSAIQRVVSNTGVLLRRGARDLPPLADDDEGAGAFDIALAKTRALGDYLHRAKL